MLSDLTSFRLPVPHLGQNNMVRNINMPYLWNSNYLEKCGEGLCHITVVSLEWGTCAGNKSDKWKTNASNHGRNYYNLELWERICKVSVGIHLQARAGEYELLGVRAYPWILSKYVCVCLFVCPPTNYIGVCILVVKLLKNCIETLCYAVQILNIMLTQCFSHVCCISTYTLYLFLYVLH